MEDCLFCKIAAGEVPSKKVYEDDKIVAFYDIAPQAPVHVLIIPRQHISSAAEIDESNAALVGHIMVTAAKLARELGVEKGFRLLTNCGEDAGQTVHHLHFHLLGGKKMSTTMV